MASSSSAATASAKRDDVVLVPDEGSDSVASASAKRRRTSPAPSRRSGRRRTHTTPSAPQPVASDATPDDAPVRPVIPTLAVDVDFLRSHGLQPLVEIFESQRWSSLLAAPTPVNLAAIRAFYSTLDLIDNKGVFFGSFTIDGEQFSFTSQNLARWLGVPHSGFGEYHKGRWPKDLPFKATSREIVEFVGETQSLSVGNASINSMGLVHRLAHRLLVGNLLPRQQKHAIVLIQDYIFLYLLLKREPINLARQILLHMDHARGIPSHALPYPNIVQLILERCDVPSAAGNDQAWEPFGRSNIEKMGWDFSASEGQWLRKGAAAISVDLKSASKGKAAADTADAVPSDLSPLVAEIRRLGDLVQSVRDSSLRDPAAASTSTAVPPPAPASDAPLVDEVRRLGHLVQSLTAKVGSLEESVNIMLVHQTTHSDRLSELIKQLRYVGTHLLVDLKLFFHNY